MKRIKVKKDNCYDCRLCELVCSQVHSGLYKPLVSRIKAPSSVPELSGPIVCKQCKNPKCVEVCPTHALKVGEWVTFDDELCNSCGLCVEACPFDSIWMIDDKCLKCDLCGGRPNCVSICPGLALSLED